MTVAFTPEVYGALHKAQLAFDRFAIYCFHCAMAFPFSSRENPFAHLSDEELDAHIRRKLYDDIELTGAVAPDPRFAVMPKEGYRHDTWRHPHSGVLVPFLMAAASRQKLLSLFDDLLTPLGDSVNVVLETSHDRVRYGNNHEDILCEGIDLPVLRSILTNYDDILLEDGCTGIAVLHPIVPMEVQFDEHKLFIIYNDQAGSAENTLCQYGLEHDDQMKFITEAAHIHSTSDTFAQRFQELVAELRGEY